MEFLSSFLNEARTKSPIITANHRVTTLNIKVDAIADSEGIPPFIRSRLNEPSVTPKPPGSIETAPTIIESAYTNVGHKMETC